MCIINIFTVRTRLSSFGQALETEQGTSLEGLKLDTDARDDINALDALVVETKTVEGKDEALIAEMVETKSKESGLVLVSNNRNKRKAIKLAYNNLMVGYFRVRRTLALLRRYFNQKGIQKDIKDYI